MDLSISVAPETIFHIGSFSVTNSHLGAILITLIIIALGVYAKYKFKLVPTRLQTVFELLSNYLLDQLTNAFNSNEKAKKFFPLIMSMLLFIFLANQLTVIPVLGQILLNGETALRTPTSHLAAPLAMAILTLATAHLLAIRISPIRYIGNFIKIKPFFSVRSVGEFGNALLEFFLGLMDIISEMAKLVSLSFRLFGNIFAGELIITVIGSLSAYTTVLAPVPFLALSIFSGAIQAFVFSMLSMQFISGTISAVEGQTADETVDAKTGLNVPATVPIHVK